MKPKKPKDALGDEIFSLYLSLQQTYASQWSQEANKWEEGSVYEKAAQLLPQNDGQVHVDVGSGLGNFLGELHKQNSNRVLLGVDQNVSMITAAAERLGAEGARLFTHACGKLDVAKARSEFRLFFNTLDTRIA